MVCSVAHKRGNHRGKPGGETFVGHVKNNKKGQKCSQKKKKPQPQVSQVWITLMWHMRLRLPWLWRLGPSNASERAHVTEMLDEHTFLKTRCFAGTRGSSAIRCGLRF